MRHATCDGKDCQLRLICERYISWMVTEEDEPDIPATYRDGECTYLIQREFYGQ